MGKTSDGKYPYGREDDKKEIAGLAVDIARVMDEKTFLTICQAYMMQHMIKNVDIQLVPPPITATKGHRECFIKYVFEPFEIPSPEKPYEGETTDDLDI